MTNRESIWSRLAGPTLLLVFGLGAWAWYLRPEKASLWAVSMFFLPGAWLLGAALRRLGIGRTMSEADRQTLRTGLTGAGVLMAASLGLAISHALEATSAATSDRVMGVVLGLMLVVLGNGMPKALEPLSRMRCDPARVQSLQRFSGWAFVLAGLAYALSHILSSSDRARLISTGILAAVVVLVLGRLLWLVIGAKATSHITGKERNDGLA